MKKALIVILALALIAAMSIVPSFAADDNVVENFDFDDDEIYAAWNKGWVDPSDSATWSDESHRADGTGSVCLESLTLNMHFSQSVTLTAGTYVFSGWMKVSDNYECTCAGATGVYISVTATGGQWPVRAGMALDSNANLSTDWQYYEATVEIPEDGDYLVALCMWGTKNLGEGTTCKVWFDDIYVGQAGSPYAPGDAPVTGDASIVAVAVVAVALVAVVARKKETV